MKIICAGQSEAGMAFSAQYADYNFCFGKGVNTPVAFAPTVAKLSDVANRKSGRERCGPMRLFMIIADETDAAARAKWDHYKAGTDQEAVAWLVEQSDADKVVRRRYQRAANGRSGIGREHQYGHACRII